jgi:hypothetical protein
MTHVDRGTPVHTRTVTSLVTCAALAAFVVGCGGESSERACARVAMDVADAAREKMGGSPRIENLAVLNGEYWCTFEVETGERLDHGDSMRVKIMQESEQTLHDFSYCGVRMSFLYRDAPDVLDTGPCPPAADPASSTAPR